MIGGAAYDRRIIKVPKQVSRRHGHSKGTGAHMPTRTHLHACALILTHACAQTLARTRAQTWALKRKHMGGGGLGKSHSRLRE